MAKRTKHYNNPNNNTHRAGGNINETADAELYNDDISRKAVGRLFNDDVRIDEDAEEEYLEDEYAEEEYAASVEDDDGSIGDDLSYQDYINSVSEFGGDRPRKGEGGRDATKSPVYKKINVPRDVPMYPAKTPKRYETEAEAAYDEDEEEPRDGGTLFGLRLPFEWKYIAMGAGVLVLIVFCFLIFKINSTGSKLQQLQVEVDAAKEIKSQNQALIIEKEDLQNRVDSLTSEKAALQEELDDLLAAQTPPETPETPDTDDTETANNNVATPPAANSAGNQMYTVVDGDNFWKIAMKFYGDGNRGEEIMKANNIDKPESLRIGTILMIP